MILDEKTLISGNGFANNALFLVGITKLQFKLAIQIVRTSIKGILSTTIVTKHCFYDIKKMTIVTGS